MGKTYDSSTESFIDCVMKYYDVPSESWVNAKSGKAYDKDSESWVERFRSYMTLTATNGIYDIADNRVYHRYNMLYLMVKPTSSTYYIRASVEGNFVNPVITGLYTMGNSDKYNLGGSSYYSHDAIDWNVRGYLNGTSTASARIVSGSSYRTETVEDAEFTKQLTGTFDKITLECVVASYSSYYIYGFINTVIKDFAIDGTPYYGDQDIFT